MGNGPQERERPAHSYADTCNVFGRRGFQVHVPSLPEIDELGQLEIISPKGILITGRRISSEARAALSLNIVFSRYPRTL